MKIWRSRISAFLVRSLSPCFCRKQAVSSGIEDLLVSNSTSPNPPQYMYRLFAKGSGLMAIDLTSLTFLVIQASQKSKFRDMVWYGSWLGSGDKECLDYAKNAVYAIWRDKSWQVLMEPAQAESGPFGHQVKYIFATRRSWVERERSYWDNTIW